MGKGGDGNLTDISETTLETKQTGRRTRRETGNRIEMGKGLGIQSRGQLKEKKNERGDYAKSNTTGKIQSKRTTEKVAKNDREKSGKREKKKKKKSSTEA